MIRLIVSLLIPQLVGFVSAGVTARGVRDWYPTIRKPGFTPPNWVFAPAWTILFVLMGIGLYLVWSQAGTASGVTLGLWVFGIQLALNSLWSILFFGFRRPDWAMVELIPFWLAIAVNIAVFWAISPAAGLLLVPYLAWVTFAGVLNWVIVRMNDFASA